MSNARPTPQAEARRTRQLRDLVAAQVVIACDGDVERITARFPCLSRELPEIAEVVRSLRPNARTPDPDPG